MKALAWILDVGHIIHSQATNWMKLTLKWSINFISLRRSCIKKKNLQWQTVLDVKFKKRNISASFFFFFGSAIGFKKLFGIQNQCEKQTCLHLISNMLGFQIRRKCFLQIWKIWITSNPEDVSGVSTIWVPAFKRESIWKNITAVIFWFPLLGLFGQRLINNGQYLDVCGLLSANHKHVIIVCQCF